MEFGIFETLALACFVLLLGTFLVNKISFFQKFNIPEPVVGGFLVALVVLGVYSVTGHEYEFHKGLQYSMMYVFFSCIGLSADFAKLIKGGKPLIIFVFVATLFIFAQNTLGILAAKLMNIDLKFGLIAGSITLTGGHGTGQAWAKTFTDQYKLQGAYELAASCATFGLIFGGIIGGPLAHRLLKKANINELDAEDLKDKAITHEITEEKTDKTKINYQSIIHTIMMISVCLVLGQYLDELTLDTYLELPTFVWCLFIGVLIRNLLTHLFKYNVSPETIDVLGNVGLSLFLAIALMSLKLWLLVGLALPVFVILMLQVALMLLFAGFVTYRIMGKDYDAIVLSAGHCGFGLGATATAVANIQAVTNRFGPSYKAFLIIPMVGAFFIDLINAIVLKLFIGLI